MHNRKVHSIIGGHIQNQMTLFFSQIGTANFGRKQSVLIFWREIELKEPFRIKFHLLDSNFQIHFNVNQIFDQLLGCLKGIDIHNHVINVKRHSSFLSMHTCYHVIFRFVNPASCIR
jgi:hypothetical protein